MSVNLDPTSKTKASFINVDPPKTEAKKQQPAIVLDAPTSGGKTDFSGFLAANMPPKFDGPGVASSAFGAASPNIKAMSDAKLAENVAKLGQAMKASPGKVNGEDFKVLEAMMDEANLRGAALLSSNKPIDKMDNRELFASLVMFDAAKASGKKLTPEQDKRLGALEAEWKQRSTYDKSSELKYLYKEREHLQSKALTHCSAAILGATSLTTHVGAFGMIGSGIVLSHAADEKAYGTVALETGLAIVARFPMTHKAAEGAAAVINTVECVATIYELEHVEAEIKKAKTP